MLPEQHREDAVCPFVLRKRGRTWPTCYAFFQFPPFHPGSYASSVTPTAVTRGIKGQVQRACIGSG